MEILKQIEEKKSELKETFGELKVVTKGHKKVMTKSMKERDGYIKLLDEKGPLLTQIQHDQI